MNFVIIRRIVTAGLGLWAAYAFARQCRRPAGWLGRRVARAMNLGHARLTAWGLSHVTIGTDGRILDVGCGGGQTIRTLAAAAPQGHVSGLDYSAASVAVASSTNAELIGNGRVDVQEGSVSRLPFPSGSFDLITAVETHYYWPDLPSDLREVLRVLKPGGRFVLIAESYRGRRLDWVFRPVMRLLLDATYLTLDEHREALTAAGFTGVQVDVDRSRGWVCAVGMRAG